MLVAIPEVLTPEELDLVRALVAQSDEAFVDGRMSAGRQARHVKKNEQLPGNLETTKQIKAIVRQGLERSYLLQVSAWPREIREPMISRYALDMTYGDHVDEWSMSGRQGAMRTDVSVTVFLSHPDEYEGGELVMQSPFGVRRVKLAAGNAICYPSTTLHRVEPVTRGVRLVAISWIQSLIRDPARREVLHDLHLLRMQLLQGAPNGPDAQTASKSFSNLMRMWADD